jgi:predicted dehydrogenase
MRELAAEKNLCTQMGNQGTAENGFRQGVATIKSGLLGPIKEIHVWTNRPIWPQGISRPKEMADVPKHIHWEEFIAGAPMRPFAKANGEFHGYTPFAWRGWLDFGTGALGDMACHTINVAAMALELFDPSSIEVVETSGIVDKETYPVWSILKFQFPERNGRPPLSMTWYDGGNNLPKEKRVTKEMLDGMDPAGSGLLLMGEKGSFYSKNDYGAEHTLLPKEKFKDVKEPEATLPLINREHFKEWVDAIQANDPKKALSNFDYAGRLTETVVLGVVALKAGTKIEWDAANMRAKNNSDADQYIRRDYRKGYGIR